VLRWDVEEPGPRAFIEKKRFEADGKIWGSCRSKPGKAHGERKWAVVRWPTAMDPSSGPQGSKRPMEVLPKSRIEKC